MYLFDLLAGVLKDVDAEDQGRTRLPFGFQANTQQLHLVAQ
jgi:hypothetical protein